MPPDLLHGRYALTRLLGRGGMAEVWEARDEVLERLVAVKTVDLSAATDPTLGERLQREAVATAALRHPDIVTVHDAGVEGSRVFFVMELVGGHDLGEVLRDGPLAVDEAARVAERVCGALAVAHRAGVVHRDVKPANVVVDGQAVTVVDFGIAAMARAAGASLTAPGTMLGTAQYMAPEQADGAAASPASDMYAVGCLLTAMVTGRPPFAADDPLQVLRQHVSSPAPRLRDERPEVPAVLDELVGELLAKDPQARPDAPEVSRRLAAMRHDAAVAGGAMATPPTPPTKVLPAAAATEVLAAHELPDPGRRPARRGRVVAAAVGAVVVLLAIALAAGGPWQQDPGAEQEATGGGTAEATGSAAEPSTEPTPEPTPEPEPPAADDVPGHLAALDVDERTRADLDKRWAEVSDALAQGDDGKAADRARDLVKRLEELVRDGEIDRAGADAVIAAVIAVVGDLTPPDDDDGDDGGDDDEKGSDKGKGKDKDD